MVHIALFRSINPTECVVLLLRMMEQSILLFECFPNHGHRNSDARFGAGGGDRRFYAKLQIDKRALDLRCVCFFFQFCMMCVCTFG